MLSVWWVTSVSLDPSGSIRWAGEAAADGQSCFVTIICCLLAAWLVASGWWRWRGCVPEIRLHFNGVIADHSGHNCKQLELGIFYLGNQQFWTLKFISSVRKLELT